MKKLSSTLIIVSVLSVGGLAYNKYNALTSKISDLTRTIGSLTSDLNAMKAKERSLKEKKRKNKKKIRNHRNALIATKLNRAKLKIAKAPASMVPVAGVAAVVAFTAYDIHNYCQDVKEFRELEVSLFGSVDDKISEDEKMLCGYDVEQELLPVIKSYTDDSTAWIVDSYNVIIDDANTLIDEWF